MIDPQPGEEDSTIEFSVGDVLLIRMSDRLRRRVPSKTPRTFDAYKTEPPA